MERMHFSAIFSCHSIRAGATRAIVSHVLIFRILPQAAVFYSGNFA
jgi:hypothetical protein